MDLLQILGIISLIQIVVYITLYFGWLARKGKATGGLLLANGLFRYIFHQNTTIGCLVHYTSQVIEGENINMPDLNSPAGKAIKASLRQSGSCYYQAKNGIIIQSGVLWGPGVKMISAIRERWPGNRYRWEKPIKIGCDSYIGANVIIMPGVQIGKRCKVSAGSIMVKDLPDDTTFINPAAEMFRLSQSDP